MPILGNNTCPRDKYEDEETVHSAEDSLWSAWYCGDPVELDLEALQGVGEYFSSPSTKSTSKKCSKKESRSSFMQQQSGRAQYNRSVSSKCRPAKNYQNRRR
jgi:hypothetical protein